ncbi:MAG: chemotaxis protein CheX [Phycisphaerae bacterium]|nr:chemotaxis protein CheX [Phycisphaerae bacterium]
MRAECINPFVESLYDVFATMLNTSLTRQGLELGESRIHREGRHLTSLIGISGDVNGVVALRFPHETALSVTTRLLHTKRPVEDSLVTDALAELANMVAGSAKAKLNLAVPATLGLPSVVEGTSYKTCFPTNAASISLAFASDAGDFSMEVSFAEQAVGVKAVGGQALTAARRPGA